MSMCVFYYFFSLCYHYVYAYHYGSCFVTLAGVFVFMLGAWT